MSYSVRYTCFWQLTYKESALMMNCKISYLNFYSSTVLEVFKNENVVISVRNVVSFEVWRRSDKCDVTTTWTNEISSCKRLARNVLREHFENVEMNVIRVFWFKYVSRLFRNYSSTFLTVVIYSRVTVEHLILFRATVWPIYKWDKRERWEGWGVWSVALKPRLEISWSY